MQSSYWRRVKRLHDVYVYNSEESPQQSEESLIKRSIQEYIETYYCPLTVENIYMKLNNIRNAMKEQKSIEEAMIIFGELYENE